MAQRFADRHEPVPVLVSSTALRALTTAKVFAHQLGHVPVLEKPGIYMASLRTLTQLVERLAEETDQVMLFGHNPGLSELVDHYISIGAGNLAPCTTVRIDLPVKHWAEAASGIGTMVWRDSPAHG